jgi:hypothetical protein
MSNDAFILTEVSSENGPLKYDRPLRKYFFVAAFVLLLIIGLYFVALFLFPSLGSHSSRSQSAQYGPVSSKKAIAQLPDQVISHPVVGKVDGLMVDENSDTMRSTAELNYRDAMEEDLARIDQVVGARRVDEGRLGPVVR